MKVTLPKDYRHRYTMENVDQARAFIAMMKEDTTTAAEVLESVGRAVTGTSVEVIAADAVVTVRSVRAPWDDETGDFTGSVSGWIAWYEIESGRCVHRVGRLFTTLADYWSGEPSTSGTYLKRYRED